MFQFRSLLPRVFGEHLDVGDGIVADYWKSQDRKYCDFCKCWIADNKPSRDFHENGKRHKDNVKKRLKSITKDSAKAFKETAKVDNAIKAMESAGMEAYRRDVEQNAAADLTSIAIAKRVEEENLEISNRKLWHEIPSTDGTKSYYWNTVTNATTWTAPAEGFLSLKEQKEQKTKELVKKLKEVNKYEQKEAMIRKQEKDLDDMEERARAAREQMKARRSKEDTPPPVVYGPIIDPGKNDPYGKWTTVVKESSTSQQIDFQLPKQEYYECPVVVEPEPIVKEFKEKTFESLDKGSSKGESSFKKRKFVSGAKRNTRQRLDVD